MAKSLQGLRREIGERLQAVAYGQIEQSLTLDSFYDDGLIINDKNYWRQGYVRLYSSPTATTYVAGRVTAFDNGVVTFRPPMASSPSGYYYELWKTFNPSDVDNAINRSLNQMGYVVREYDNFEASVYAYDLPSALRKLLRVEVLLSADEYRPLGGYELSGYPGAYVLNLNSEGRQFVTDYPTATICYVYERAFPGLTGEADTTSAQPLWLEYLALADLYEMLLRRTQKEDREEIMRNLAYFQAKAREMRDEYAYRTSGIRIEMSRKVTD